MQETVLVSNWSDSAFALDVAHHFGQHIDISDLISLKNFANSEFCPRFLVDDQDLEHIGQGLSGKRIYIISTSSPQHTRVELAMRNFLIASAAKENGASEVVLIEPDLFFSAQDRGPHFVDHPQMEHILARKKFDGQPFSARLYAHMLRQSGVDQVVTVHNHKPAVIKKIYEDEFQLTNGKPALINLDITSIVAHFIIATIQAGKLGENVCFVAPDEGAWEFASAVRQACHFPSAALLVLKKTRTGQRSVSLDADDDLSLLKGKQVVILDDMVRTGGTIAETMRILSENPNWRPADIFFYCTHGYLSAECRENLHSPALTEFITTNTLPNVLDRDAQGRLRKKMVVLKIESWIADALRRCLEGKEVPEQCYSSEATPFAERFYQLDFSSRNERRHPTVHIDQLAFALRS